MASKALHVGVIRGGKFIDDRYFPEGGNVTVGENEKNTFALPLSRLPDTHGLFVQRRAGYALVLTDQMQGRVQVRGREVQLTQLSGEGLAKRAAHGIELPLDENVRGRVSLGEVTFVFNFAPPPPKAPRPVLPAEARGTLWNISDHTFAAVLACSLALHCGAVAALSRRTLPPEDASIEEIPDRFAKLLIPEKPEVLEQPKEEEKPVDQAPAKEEKKKDEARKEEPARDSAEHKAAVQKAVAQKGLIKILGSVGGGQGSGALANVLAAGGGFSDDIGAALAGAGGVAIATSAGGPVRRGEGTAQAAGIGSLATSGGGGGGLREKRDVAVHGQVTSDDAEVDSPTVDKEALGKFIRLRLRSIQGCYEAQLKRSPTLRGKLVLRFTIGTRGQITEVTIDSDSMANNEVASCVVRLVRAWRLPFTPDAETQVSFPFLFQPG